MVREAQGKPEGTQKKLQIMNKDERRIDWQCTGQEGVKHARYDDGPVG